MPLHLAAISCLVSALVSAQPAAAEKDGVAVAYQLPVDGPTPATYRVTLAIVDPKNPDWIISQFACGVVRTVTAENQGRFRETWNGLDDNFMPVPPGEYAVKGIYMPAAKWPIDGEYHSVTPRFAGGASSWLPSPEDVNRPEPFGGDPCGAPLGDVAVGPNGIGVFYYVYLENGRNNPMFDFNRPVGYGQCLRAFASGGAGGGDCVATDGETVWAASTDGGPKFVYRADGKSFGNSPEANRHNSYLPDGWVTAMAAWRDPHTGRSIVYVAQRGKFDQIMKNRHRAFLESDTPVDKVTVHDGADGRVLAEVPLVRPRGLAVEGDTLYGLHGDGSGFAVSKIPLDAGVPKAPWRRCFALPAGVAPGGLAVDRHGLIYVSQPAVNQVVMYDAAGKTLGTIGRPGGQKPGAYDRQALMTPGKMAAWTDRQGNDRLIVIERAGPNRASEWSPDGRLLREFLTLQTKANDGYAIDPEHPEQVYVPGQQGWLTRFRVDYRSGQWTIDAVWPEVGTDPLAPELQKPVFIRTHGHEYLAASRGGRQGAYSVYRLDGDRWRLSAAILRRPSGDTHHPFRYFLWHDANSNGRVDEDELRPSEMPEGMFSYHGQNWAEDLSFLAIQQQGRGVWRLAPDSFDTHGNPIFRTWQRLFSDPVFEARARGKADAVHGGNELDDTYSSAWCQADGSPTEGYYVHARAGKNFSANDGAQYKVSRYAPDGAGGYRLVWRTGRAALGHVAEPGEIVGAMRIRRPINGLVSIVDQSRCGVLLYNADGLYVDTLFPDARRLHWRDIGIYSLPGEFFVGTVFPNKDNGKVYFAAGKYTPLVFEACGWSLTESPVRPLKEVAARVTLRAAEIANPPEIAISVRGGSGAARVARFAPALGGAVLDGTMAGWEACEPMQLAADQDQTVEVRCLYDPEHLYLRWHARLGRPFAARPLPPLERVFTHDQLADTLSFYVQGDAAAAAGGAAAGRPGDVRFVFGLFEAAGRVEPVCVGLYPEWPGPGTAHPQVYRTPVGQAAFAHVGRVEAKLAQVLDADGRGFVLVAAIPRSAVPRLASPFAEGLRTMVNFEATFGHNKFWWANSDGSASRETYDEPTEARLYPGSWAPAQFQGVAEGVVIRNWLVCGPFGGPGAEKFRADPRGPMPGTNRDMKRAVHDFCEAAAYPPDSGKVDRQSVYRGEMIRGYWNDPREVRWWPATIADLDNRVVLGPSAQVWYAATWIHASAETELEFQFQGHRQTELRWFLNDRPVMSGDQKKAANDPSPHPVARKTLRLRAGWNQVFVRGYCVGYPPFRVGLVLAGPPEKLWQLRFAAAPP